VAVDIGAYCGAYSILRRRSVERPDTSFRLSRIRTHEKLFAKNLGLNPEIKRPTVESSACSNENGQTTLFSGSLARSAVEFSPAHYCEEIRVRTITLDSYLEEHRLRGASSSGAALRQD
jgi:FkbM family methyltransferase